MVTPDAKRKAVAHACTVHAVSQRRACLALKIDRSTARYASTRPDDGLSREAMKAVVGERRQFGYRRIQIMLEARSAITSWKEDDNRHRPHSALDNMTPAEFALKSTLENRPLNARNQTQDSPSGRRRKGSQVTERQRTS
ncbi:integrase core domain-containing protein [Bosea sp. (in: a-proteobacteria)]|uniref:integrase core domain-containing protein n=1 Tax=Bosea sp. (in: a-proteobacteria) TaxID=1871050 RepID=UPI001AD0D20A|nr:integrase core domain-containing protein [Bosea sp. (in: a-proteobacteria)]MBN9439128.1 transposase [Bosea sp. (in: a-proteobacteria)]